jgi:acyl-CoA oxidase
MEHGRLSSQRAKAISREVDALCRRVRPIARELVDAFGVPAEMQAVEMMTSEMMA